MDYNNQESLEFEWLAIYKDGTILEQRYHEGDLDPKTGKYSLERHLGMVDNSQLKTIAFTNKKHGNNKIYMVDLETGVFNLNGVIIKTVVQAPANAPKTREFIAFRRTIDTSNPNTNERTFENSYAIGFKVKFQHGGTQEEKQQDFIFIFTPSGDLFTSQAKM